MLCACGQEKSWDNWSVKLERLMRMRPTQIQIHKWKTSWPSVQVYNVLSGPHIITNVHRPTQTHFCYEAVPFGCRGTFSRISSTVLEILNDFENHGHLFQKHCRRSSDKKQHTTNRTALRQTGLHTFWILLPCRKCVMRGQNWSYLSCCWYLVSAVG